MSNKVKSMLVIAKSYTWLWFHLGFSLAFPFTNAKPDWLQQQCRTSL